VKHVAGIGEQLPSAPADEDDVTLRGGRAGGFGQSVDVPLMRRVEAKPILQADLFLVEPFQLGIGEMFHGGSAVQQFAVEQLPAERFGQPACDLVAAGAVLTRYGDRVHGPASTAWGAKERPHRERGPRRSLDVFCKHPPPRRTFEVGVISVPAQMSCRGCMANPIAIRYRRQRRVRVKVDTDLINRPGRMHP
jgi:hypothetical protein